MKLLVLTSIVLISITSAYADCRSSFESGYQNAVSAQQACGAGKKAAQSISTFMNSAEENCGYAKLSLDQYNTCKELAQKGINNFEQVDSQCDEHNMAQGNIRILNSFIFEANDYNNCNHNIIKMFCK